MKEYEIVTRESIIAVYRVKANNEQEAISNVDDWDFVDTYDMDFGEITDLIDLSTGEELDLTKLKGIKQ